MFYKIKVFLAKIKKLLSYIPVLWKDEEWDYEFLLILIYYKVLKINKFFSKEGSIDCTGSKEVLKGTSEVLKHIDNFRNYINVYNREHNLSDNMSKNVKLDKDYISKVNLFEQNEWDNIWDTLKREGRKWWD